MSRSGLARRFTVRLGQRPLAYLTWWRMTVAARLLRRTDDSVKLVAEQVGYHEAYGFNPAFRNQYGVAPGRYRTATRELAAQKSVRSGA